MGGGGQFFFKSLLRAGWQSLSFAWKNHLVRTGFSLIVWVMVQVINLDRVRLTHMTIRPGKKTNNSLAVLADFILFFSNLSEFLRTIYYSRGYLAQKEGEQTSLGSRQTVSRHDT